VGVICVPSQRGQGDGEILGRDAEKCAAAWEEWQRSAAGLQVALDGISQLMGQAGSAYAEAESSIAGTFR
jgi:uncharacterized protein YukE